MNARTEPRLKSTSALSISALIACVVAAPLSAWSLSASAERINIEAATKSSGLSRPTKGMSSADVEQRYGVPRQRVPAVGDPPISRWVYDRFVVYFESDRVIHTVVKRTPNASK